MHGVQIYVEHFSELIDQILGIGALSINEHLCGGLESSVRCQNRQGIYINFDDISNCIISAI